MALTSGCKSDDKQDASTSTTTAVTAPTTSTSVTAPPGPAQTVEAAAKGLYDAWTRNDDNDMSHYAKPDVIARMKEHPYATDTGYDSQGCEPQGGQFICSWTYPGGALQMTVEAWPGGGYVVAAVRYIAD